MAIDGLSFEACIQLSFLAFSRVLFCTYLCCIMKLGYPQRTCKDAKKYHNRDEKIKRETIIQNTYPRN